MPDAIRRLHSIELWRQRLEQLRLRNYSAPVNNRRTNHDYRNSNLQWVRHLPQRERYVVDPAQRLLGRVYRRRNLCCSDTFPRRGRHGRYVLLALCMPSDDNDTTVNDNYQPMPRRLHDGVHSWHMGACW